MAAPGSALRAWMVLTWLGLLGGWRGASAGGLSGAPDVKTVRDVYNLMYREQARLGGAYLLLNSTGAVGSQGPADGSDAEGVLVHARQLAGGGAAAPPGGGRWVALVPVAESHALLRRLVSDERFAAAVAGVLVDDADPPPAYSPLPKFPGAAFAPYAAAGYEWNPAGSGAAELRFPVPVVLLEPALARDARERANFNAQQGHHGRAYHARIRMQMAASSAANASDCLAADSCRPLGGFSVWAALPPIPAGANATKPTLLVVAQIDGTDLFHDSIQGANAPLSGLVALLAAASLLGDSPALRAGAADRQVVFLALAGEPWGYMGSKSFLWELERRGAAVAGLDLGLIDQVLEIGPVGRASRGDPPAARLYAHAQAGAGFGDAAPLVSALEAAADGLPGGLKASVSPASADNPGIPPSSLMSFLRVKPSVAGVVLTEFDRAYSDPYSGSRFDNGSRLDAASVAAAAAVVAGAVQRLAGGAGAQLQVNASRAEALAAAFASCLVMPDPGLACPEAAALMEAGYTEADGVRSYAPKHYLGVMQYIHPDPQSPSFRGDVARFVWNALAAATAGGAPRGAACDPVKNKCPVGQVCVGWKRGDSDPALLGTCANATAAYIPALSARVACDGCDGTLGPFSWAETNASDAWSAAHGWPADPMWAESNWPLGVPFVQIYLLKPYGSRVGVLVAGLALTAAAVLGSLTARRKFEKHLKRN
ncbi:nicastrin [Raphidocelis subcapitata]|uniref:Nicastrin n=1 Tax=Raphidocelis subcapitata TaxID=307507 RepID=A0A2V0P0Z9_9CHLO|nr:nicastrin [Raphidocelis subcapitata]|eukprot:GBF91523.1 nicastrin [Raphidocelis subcapitata]